VGGEPSQRDRALEAMVELIAREGYASTTVSGITAAARISRTTFYEHFEDKQECFLEAQRELSASLLGEVEQTLCDGEPTRALAIALEALTAAAGRDPRAFHLVCHEAMVAGPVALDARDELMLAIERAIDARLAEAEPVGLLVDIPTKLVLGGAVRLLGISIRRGAGALEPSVDQLPGWLDCYGAPVAAVRWRDYTSAGELDLSASAPTRPLAPQPLPRGRHRLSPEVVRGVQRERILHAYTEVIRSKGYAAMTVADIAAEAGLSREVFYEHFADKRDAFVQTRQLVFEQMIAASAGAFFTSEISWPERIWEAMRRTSVWILDHPNFAHFDFVESYALGPADAKSVDENVLAFNIFLEEGYRRSPEAAELPRLYAEAVAGAVLELVAFYVRHDRYPEAPRLLPLLTYLILAPFTGVAEANELIDGFLAEGRRAQLESTA
jgi:AcrR family transcriptional regulator